MGMFFAAPTISRYLQSAEAVGDPGGIGKALEEKDVFAVGAPCYLGRQIT